MTLMIGVSFLSMMALKIIFDKKKQDSDRAYAPKADYYLYKFRIFLKPVFGSAHIIKDPTRSSGPEHLIDVDVSLH